MKKRKGDFNFRKIPEQKEKEDKDFFEQIFDDKQFSSFLVILKEKIKNFDEGGFLNECKEVGSRSYENLEWIGDSYLGFHVTQTLKNSFPFLSTGLFSKLREFCTKNYCLSIVFDVLDIDNLLKINYPATKKSGRKRIKQKGDILEAIFGDIKSTIETHERRKTIKPKRVDQLKMELNSLIKFCVFIGQSLFWNEMHSSFNIISSQSVSQKEKEKGKKEMKLTNYRTKKNKLEFIKLFLEQHGDSKLGKVSKELFRMGFNGKDLIPYFKEHKEVFVVTKRMSENGYSSFIISLNKRNIKKNTQVNKRKSIDANPRKGRRKTPVDLIIRDLPSTKIKKDKELHQTQNINGGNFFLNLNRKIDNKIDKKKEPNKSRTIPVELEPVKFPSFEENGWEEKWKGDWEKMKKNIFF